MGMIITENGAIGQIGGVSRALSVWGWLRYLRTCSPGYRVHRVRHRSGLVLSGGGSGMKYRPDAHSRSAASILNIGVRSRAFDTDFWGRERLYPAYSYRVTELRFTKESDASRYTLHRGKNLVSVLDYNDDGRSIAMTRAYTVPTYRGHGYAGVLVDRAVSELEAEGMRTVIPVCWYVADWFDSNPSREAILHPRRTA